MYCNISDTLTFSNAAVVLYNERQLSSRTLATQASRTWTETEKLEVVGGKSVATGRPWSSAVDRSTLRPQPRGRRGRRAWNGDMIMHYTAGCTAGWVNWAQKAQSSAALQRSSQDAYEVIRLTRIKAAAWTVDDVARLTEFLKRILIYFLPPVAYNSDDDKN